LRAPPSLVSGGAPPVFLTDMSCRFRTFDASAQLRADTRLGFVLVAVVCGLTAACSHGTNYYLTIGNQSFAAHKYEEAALQYSKALQKDPNSSEALYRLGLTRFEQNLFSEAYPLLLAAVKKSPENTEAKIKLDDVSLALYVASPNHPRVFYDQITKTSDELLAKDSNLFDALRQRGALRLIDRDPKAAIAVFEKANRIKPLQHDVIVGLVQALILDNQVENAERLAGELIKKEPSFGPIYDVLVQHYRTRRPADAENILKLKVSNNPSQADYRVQLADYYARQRNPADMAAALQPLLLDSKHFPDGALKTGDFYARLGNWPEAERAFEQGAHDHPSEALVYQKKIADALIMQGKKAEATHIVASIAKDHPNDTEVSRARAALRMESGKQEDIDMSLAELGSLVKLAPGDPLLRYDYGRCWLLKGDQRRAQAEFTAAVHARRDFLPALYALSKINLSQRNDGEALRYAQQILAYQPNNLDARQLQVDSLIDAGRLPEAQGELTALLRDHPENPNVQLQLGFLKLAQKKYVEAENIFKSVHSSGSASVASTVGLTQTYSNEQNLEKAIQMLNEQVEKSPNSVATRRLLATTAARARKYEIAISTYQDLIAKQPKSSELYTQLGQVYRAKGDSDSAIAAFQKATELAPSQAFPVTLLAISLDGAHRREEAKKNYQRALQLEPENAPLLNNFAYLLAQTGTNLDDALQLAQRALRKQPGNPDFWDTIAYIYLKKGMIGSAIQTYTSLVHRYPNSSIYHYHLGMAFMGTGDLVKAKTELQNALANGPSQEDETNVRQLLHQLGA
jgi:tetratricopeptide (TPR) repeat protein